VAFLFYGLIGATFGGLSLLFLPMHLIKNRAGQYANLILTPIVIGFGACERPCSTPTGSSCGGT
jgi:hypothetical protein